MKRELKFRAWQHESMVYTEGAMANLGRFFRCAGYDENTHIMQFTGLTDSNGKDIYEGDVLWYIGTNMSNMVVTFENGCFSGDGPFNTRPLIDCLNANDFELIEVLGNIYEHKELLTH